MNPPKPPELPAQQPVVLTAPPQPTPVNLGIRGILKHLAEPATTKSRHAEFTSEHQKHLDKIASLAKQLRTEIDALAKLEPGAK